MAKTPVTAMFMCCIKRFPYITAADHALSFEGKGDTMPEGCLIRSSFYTDKPGSSDFQVQWLYLDLSRLLMDAPEIVQALAFSFIVINVKLFGKTRRTFRVFFPTISAVRIGSLKLST
ncbi:hypothetical protein SAMN05216308_10565 [Nitrosospira sp. Nsp13]|nr:hypothetical protein SAMN05216308_10565 [Nitrosospira sp. Nsp13]